MSDSDSDEEVKEQTEEPKTTKKKKKPESQMSIEQFFKRSGSKLTRYEQAYVSVSYVGTMKTSKEWESELSSLGL